MEYVCNLAGCKRTFTKKRGLDTHQLRMHDTVTALDKTVEALPPTNSEDPMSKLISLGMWTEARIKELKEKLAGLKALEFELAELETLRSDLLEAQQTMEVNRATGVSTAA